MGDRDTPRNGTQFSKALASAGYLFKTVSTIVGTTILVGGLAVTGVLWFVGVQTKTAAAESEAVINERIDGLADSFKVVGNDVKIIKCLLIEEDSRKRETCGLQP